MAKMRKQAMGALVKYRLYDTQNIEQYWLHGEGDSEVCYKTNFEGITLSEKSQSQRDKYQIMYELITRKYLEWPRS